MHDLLFTRADALTPEDLLSHAEELGLDLERFALDLREETHVQRVRDDVESAGASGATGTPTFFVQDLRHSGHHDAATLIRELQAALDAGGASSPRPRASAP